MLFENMTAAIGHTPVVRAPVEAADGVEVFFKLEFQNLYGMKDRVARSIILRARERGVLADGAPIIESSSGTMALGVALVGRSLGHPVHIVTDPRIDRITLAKLRSLGCEVHIVSGMGAGGGWQSARLELLRRLRADLPGAFWPNQYQNPDNPAAYRTLAAELREDVGDFDILVGSVGSGGSLCGTSRALRAWLPRLRVLGVDSIGSVLFGQPDQPGRRQSGLGNSLLPGNLDRRLIDEVHWLNDREAFTATHELAREQQIFAGNTSGSVYRVVRYAAARAEPGTRIVGILPDRGDRYVYTIYDDDYWAEQGFDELPDRAAPVSIAPRGGQVATSWSRAEDIDRSQQRQSLLFVESNTTGTGTLALSLTAESGLRPVLLTHNPDRYRGVAETGALVVTCDTNSVERLRQTVLTEFRREEIAGITTTSDFYLTHTAELAHWLGLPGSPVDAVLNCRDKSRTRRLLTAAGLPQPRFAVLTAGPRGADGATGAAGTAATAGTDSTAGTRGADGADGVYAAPGTDATHGTPGAHDTRGADAATGMAAAGTAAAGDLLAEAAKAVSHVSFPCVVKPVDDSGSNQVLRCESVDDVARQAALILAEEFNIRGQRTTGAVLVEEYLDGPEYSVETLSRHGVAQLVGVTEKHVTGAPHFVEHRHVFPAPLPPDRAEDLASTVRQALAATGFTDGAAHTEVRLTAAGPVVIEINGRPAGGMIPELIRLATGLRMQEQQLRIALGEHPAVVPAAHGYAAIQFILPDRSGTLARVDGVDAARAVHGVRQVVVTAAPGQQVRSARNAYHRLGYVIAFAASAEDATTACAKGGAELTVVLEDQCTVRTRDT